MRMNRLRVLIRVLGSHGVEGVFCVEVIAGVEKVGEWLMWGEEGDSVFLVSEGVS